MKQMILPNMGRWGLIQSAEDLNRTKGLSKKKLLLPNCLEQGHWSFPDFRLKLKCQFFLGLELASVLTRTYTVGSLDHQFANSDVGISWPS